MQQSLDAELGCYIQASVSFFESLDLCRRPVYNKCFQTVLHKDNLLTVRGCQES